MTKTPHSISDVHEYMRTSRDEWESRSRGEVGDGGRGGVAGVWKVGVLAR